jgi:myo-inositol catabolism protein IolC
MGLSRRPLWLVGPTEGPQVRALEARPHDPHTPAALTSFSPFEAWVRVLLAEHPEMPATVLAERAGWEGSITWFRDNVRR